MTLKTSKIKTLTLNEVPAFVEGKNYNLFNFSKGFESLS